MKVNLPNYRKSSDKVSLLEMERGKVYLIEDKFFVIKAFSNSFMLIPVDTDEVVICSTNSLDLRNYLECSKAPLEGVETNYTISINIE